MISRLLRLFRKSALDCPEVRAAASDFIDGDLSDRDSAGISSHLEWCGPCLRFINTLRATVSMLRSMPRSEPPEGYTTRLHQMLGRERQT